MNNLSQRSFDNVTLDKTNLLQSMINKALEYSFLNENEVEIIKSELQTFIIYCISTYSTNGISSMRITKAEEIAKASIYLMQLYLKSLSQTEALSEIKECKFQKIYDNGAKIAHSKYISTLSYISNIKKNLFKNQNIMLLDIVHKGFDEFISNTSRLPNGNIAPLFFLHCSDSFDFSYMPCLFDSSLKGIEAIEDFVHCLKLENDFLSQMDESVIQMLSEQKVPEDISEDVYDDIFGNDFSFSTENIFLIALKHVLEQTPASFQNDREFSNKYLASLQLIQSTSAMDDELYDYCKKAINLL